MPSVVNVTVLDVRNTSVSMEWEEPRERNGIILNYAIQWTAWDDPNVSAVHELSPDVFNYTLHNLTPFTNYIMEVFATTRAGRGASNPFNVSTLTGCKILSLLLVLKNIETRVDGEESTIEFYGMREVILDEAKPSLI